MGEWEKRYYFGVAAFIALLFAVSGFRELGGRIEPLSTTAFVVLLVGAVRGHYD